MSVDQLVDSLLYEGYALYPYTPGATKNATPTPHGIVYPPAYAAANPFAKDHLRAEVILEFEAGATLSGSVHFLQASGDGHRGVARALALGPASLDQLRADGVGQEFGFDGEEELAGRVRMRAERLDSGVARVRLCVHNSSDLPAGAVAGRPEALRSSLLSTHVVIRVEGGRFVSPVENEGPRAAAVAACENLNTWPVLATPDDDAVLGASMFLPDHPRIAPESLGGLFDSTEIEEALLLHVQTLSEEERAEITDPKVREMIERAETASPEEMIALHGRLESGSPKPGDPEPGHPQSGKPEWTVGGRTIKRGAGVLLRPRKQAGDTYDVILAGKAATIERIYIDYEDGVHLGVTIDDDPGQELMRDTGRYLYFKPEEVELR
ncbi:MAG TPA: hypothetical protein VGG40_03755 [Solirubrobacterales bacterium]